ncbi:histone deacetylase family protein [Hyphobacterium sp. CCMP332]|uniref:histone deacetylase family protein n=1 Tax=Hyphobacterium sp. CCMP332 TaxID=2749086 RepID=UPI00164EFE55|nr:histone deacetylase family protein [Hyphobacterium sp. CCMP332]QNL19195.1 histone deacetylase family protein [Hyphobacterium sp. CCMP332]
MKILILTSDAGFDHRVPPPHFENPVRLRAVLDAMADTPSLAGLDRIQARAASREEVGRMHTARHVDAVFNGEPADHEAFHGFDFDTFMCRGSLNAALRGAGAAVQAVDMIMAGNGEAAFCATRPPGHHAERDRPMGFCLFNNVGVAAMHALEHHGLSRVAIIDIDVHHGNGSQDLAESEPRVMFASIHESPLYPGTGMEDETGLNGNVVNVPVGAGCDGATWRARLDNDLFPRIAAFKPEFLLVSAGFDGHRADPLGGLLLDEGDYIWAASRLCDLARKTASSRLVCCLEGGYDNGALGRSAAAFTESLSIG